ncbi:MAG: 5-formyltetrahydrofolate cyclo-ligase [Steroidobacter sp.]
MPMADAQLIHVSPAQLRKDLRQRRRMLSVTYRKLAAQRVKTLFARSGWLRSGQRIAVYLATSEELDLQPLIELAWRNGCRIFIPHITHTRRRRMAFHAYHANTKLVTHRWGIKQPATLSAPVATRTLDAVLLPTVGFDHAGHRLGMGGGFYDRHFTNLHHTRLRKPVLIGVAYACQEVPAIEAQPHDIQLDAILTERTFSHF